MVLEVEKARRLCVAFVAVDRANIAGCVTIKVACRWEGTSGSDSHDNEMRFLVERHLVTSPSSPQNNIDV